MGRDCVGGLGRRWKKFRMMGMGRNAVVDGVMGCVERKRGKGMPGGGYEGKGKRVPTFDLVEGLRLLDNVSLGTKYLRRSLWREYVRNRNE